MNTSAGLPARVGVPAYTIIRLCLAPDVVVGLMTWVWMPVSSWASSYMTMSKEKPRREDLVLVENWMTPPELNRIHSWPVCEQTSTRSLRQRGIPSDVSSGRRPKILRKRSTISMVVE